jgi:hypothetical protein
MGTLLPKMEQDDLLNDKIWQSVTLFDKKSTLDGCMRLIEKRVKDIDYPFTNIKEEDRISIY